MNYYVAKLEYDRISGEDNPGRVRETYLVEGDTCSEIEARVIEHVKPYICGQCELPSIKKRLFFDVFTSTGENFYEGKIEIITVDGEKETRKAVNVLVQENDIDDALDALKKQFSSYDCEIIGLKKSQIIDFLPSHLPESNFA